MKTPKTIVIYNENVPTIRTDGISIFGVENYSESFIDAYITYLARSFRVGTVRTDRYILIKLYNENL